MVRSNHTRSVYCEDSDPVRKSGGSHTHTPLLIIWHFSSASYCLHGRILLQGPRTRYPQIADIPLCPAMTSTEHICLSAQRQHHHGGRRVVSRRPHLWSVLSITSVSRANHGGGRSDPDACTRDTKEAIKPRSGNTSAAEAIGPVPARSYRCHRRRTERTGSSLSPVAQQPPRSNAMT